LPLLSVSSAERIAGSAPSKATSTTAPITWLMRPTLLVVVGRVPAASAFGLVARGLRAGFSAVGASVAIAVSSFERS